MSWVEQESPTLCARSHGLNTGSRCCRLTEACLEETVAHYTAAMLVYCKSITEKTLAIMEQDSKDISAFFSRLCKPDKV